MTIPTFSEEWNKILPRIIPVFLLVGWCTSQKMIYLRSSMHMIRVGDA